METTWGAASRQREMLLAPFSASAQSSRDVDGNGTKSKGRKGRDRDDDDTVRPQSASRRLKVKHSGRVDASQQESLSPLMDGLKSPVQLSVPAFATTTPTCNSTSQQSFGMAGFHSDFTFSLGADDPYYSLFSLPVNTVEGTQLTSPTTAAPLSTTLDAYMQSLQPDYDTANTQFLPPLSYFLASPPNFDAVDSINDFVAMPGQF